jgi:hypothetical protein
MISATVQDICSATSAQVIAPLAAGASCTLRSVDVVIDSRRVQKGSMFVAFIGEHTNGNDYALRALEAGASCICLTQDAPQDLICAAEQNGCVLLRAQNDDAQTFLLRLASWWRTQNMHWIVVGITGSCGKTTTKDLCAQALATRYRVHATQGNFNNLIGVPLTILSASAQDEVIVCEMGMNHPGELATLSRVALPCLCVITNIGTSHIGILGSREAIATAKLEIITAIRGYTASSKAHASEHTSAQLPAQKPLPAEIPPMLLLDAHDDFCAYLTRHAQQYEYDKEAGAPAQAGSAHDGCNLRISYIDHGQHVAKPTPAASSAAPEPSSFQVARASVGAVCISTQAPISLDEHGCAHTQLTYADGETHALSMSQPSKAACIDALFALAIADELACDRSAAIRAIEACSCVHMRLEEISRPHKPFIIDDSYNASPASIAQALAVLHHCTGYTRHIAILGEVGELGSQSARLHDYIGAYAAASGVDMLVFVGGEDAKRMVEAARTMGYPAEQLHYVRDVHEAQLRIAPLLRETDAVLVKASRACMLDVFVKGVIQ